MTPPKDTVTPAQEAGSHAAGGGRDLSQRTALIGLAIILVVAFALRIYGVNWDEGYSWTPHPDERAILSKVSELSPPPLSDLPILFDAEASPWNPRWFAYGSFPLYMLKGVELLSAFVPGLNLQDMRVPGRLLSALADIGTIVFVYLLGASLWTRRSGLLAAALVGLAVLHIQLSHFFAVDTFLALFSTATIFFLVRVARRGRTLDSMLAGLFLGLALATKISFAPMLAAYFVAHFMYAFGLAPSDHSRPAMLVDRILDAIKGAAFGGLAAIAAFLVTQPYAILDWVRFYGDVVEQSEMVRRIRDYPYTRQYVDTTPYIYQIRQMATWGLGWPVGIVAFAGTIYAAIRGLKFPWAIAYLIVGFAMPVGVLVMSASSMAILVASFIAVAAIVVSLPMRRPETRIGALLVSWVVPYFLITGAFEVKFLRYLLPIAPVMLLLGSRMLFDWWEYVCGLGPRIRRVLLPASVAVGAVAALVTVFYALAYMSVYTSEHPAVRGAEWIRENVPQNSVIIKEHWEEGLPGLHSYRILELPMYNDDRPHKINQISDLLSRADILTLYSNRLYGTVPRLEERYPVSREYYRLLFEGQLGYELEAHFTSYPSLFGVALVDDTFRRPRLPVPAGIGPSEVHSAEIELGYADESFSVYDHPKVLIFGNVSRLDAETISDRILSAAGGFPDNRAAPPPAERPEEGRRLMLTPEQSEAQQSGGTWSEIVDTDGWAGRMPIVAWLIVVQGIGVLAFPLSFVVFRPLADKGWLLAKGLGLLLVGLVAWLLASLELVTFGKLGVTLGVLALFAASAVTLTLHRKSILRFLKDRWKTVAVSELVFLAAFLAFVLIRMANPDLWHPYRGGEKPMDMAYLNAVLKSSYMPPYDPWFGGGYINYYYWGQFLVAVLIHATGIVSEVAVNLTVPLFFALTVAFGYSIVYNLACSSGRVRTAPPVLAGICGGVFVAILGNLDGAIQVGQAAWRAIVGAVPVGEFDFWRSSRMMGPDPPGHEITEFPYFTFLFADPHAHLLALPFTLLSVGVAAAVVLGMAQRSALASAWSPAQICRVLALGLAVGALRLLNTWDYPTYLLLGMGAVTLGEYLAQGGVSLSMLFRAAIKSILVLAVGYLAFLPYHLNYEAFFTGVEGTTNTTTLWQFLAIHGLFIFVIASFCVWELRPVARRAWGKAKRLAVLSEDSPAGVPIVERLQIGVGTILATILGLVFAGYGLTALTSGFDWNTVLMIGILMALTGAVGVRVLGSGGRVTAAPAFVCLMTLAAFSVVVGLDFIRVEGDIDRMNTVFKFYLQVWVLLALASAYMVWRLLDSGVFSGVRMRAFRYAWAGVLVTLLIGSAIYPVLGTQDRLRDRFDGKVTPLTLDGLAFISGSVYRDLKGRIDLERDFEGIRWLRENVQGSPVVLEANTPTYRWGGRVSIHTGLPSVVGWKWHQEQQRWGYRDMVGSRIRDVNRIYSTSDASQALNLLDRYGVKYVYVGQLERLYYQSDGIAKFEGELAPHLRTVFETDEVTIYEVLN